ncbi:MAG: histidinol dehydrogenase, partial [Acidobacteriota bacterium]
ALAELPARTAALLARTAERIRFFARQQRQCLANLNCALPGGRGGHRVRPVERAGCYAPGGRHPLPSTLLMTAVTASTAGVQEIWVATPRPGAVALAALAYGAGDIPPSDVVVGQGNRWVTAAKEILAGPTRIDLLGGPSELAILADQSADPAWVAADLLAQAEHDPESLAFLISTWRPLLAAVNEQLAAQCRDLSTAPTARIALARGGAVVVDSLAAAIQAVNRLAPEHLQIMTRQAEKVAQQCHHQGALFIGAASPAVLGDYGSGPNHVLPTGGTARSTGGLSVLTFLCVRTWEQMERLDPRMAAAALARLEGLEAHARAMERRVDGGRNLPYPPPAS